MIQQQSNTKYNWQINEKTNRKKKARKEGNDNIKWKELPLIQSIWMNNLINM